MALFPCILAETSCAGAYFRSPRRTIIVGYRSLVDLVSDLERPYCQDLEDMGHGPLPF